MSVAGQTKAGAHRRKEPPEKATAGKIACPTTIAMAKPNDIELKHAPPLQLVDAFVCQHGDPSDFVTARAQSWQQGALTFRVAKECFGLWEAALHAAKLRDLDLFRVPLIGLL